MPTFYDLMKFDATGIAAPDMSAYDKARSLAAFGGGKMQTLTGVPPLTFKSDGTPLISWSMFGNTKQTGTPSPQNIIMPDFCGKLVGSDWVIPITCAGQTTPVYLGQVSTVRRIKKLVLTGAENYMMPGNNTWLTIGTSVADFRGMADGAICSHLPLVTRSNFTTNTCAWGLGRIGDFLINIDNKNMNELKQYIAQQYSDGTPVTVWYVLNEPETAIVNEPLAKIGDYADELHSADAGVSIPTAKGQNTLTVDTELQPSSMTITYKS